MKQLISFIRLEMTLRWRGDSEDRKNKAVSVILSVITYAVIMLLLYVFTQVLTESFGEGVTAGQISVFFMLLVEIVLTFSGISWQIKYLLRPSDMTITARFPLSSFQLFAANLIIIYVNLAISAFIFTVSVMTVYGLAAEIYTLEYFFGTITAGLFAPLIPFALSVFIAVPVMYLMALLENHNYVKLAIFVICTVAFFVCYDYVLRVLAEYFIHKHISTETVKIWDKAVFALNGKYNPFLYTTNLLYFKDVWLSLGVIIGISAVFGGVGILIAKPVYEAVRKRTLEGKRSVFNKKVKLTSDNVVTAVLKKEFKEIFRTKVYLYYYLGIAVATPVMVFFCNRLVREVGQAQIGSSVSFGTSILVVTAFMAMINVFSANTLSKEGKQFFITKILPLSYTVQLLIKGMMSLLVSIGALTISCFVIGVLEFVTPAQVFAIAAFEILMACAFILSGFVINLRHPRLANKADGDVSEVNTGIIFAMGIVISAITGGISIIAAYSLGLTVVYASIFTIAVVYLAVIAAVFFTKAEKWYYRIEK